MVLGQEEAVHLLEVCADNRDAEDIPTKGKERERFILSLSASSKKEQDTMEGNMHQ